jgi:mannose/fructose/N-acetylgalactosamine-specific phosphotransferase system component IIC
MPTFDISSFDGAYEIAMLAMAMIGIIAALSKICYELTRKDKSENNSIKELSDDDDSKDILSVEL